MGEPTPQTYANHRRLDPVYHFVLFGLLGANFVYSVVHAYRAHSRAGWMGFVVAVALLILYLKLRTYALRVQDRVIRLEETFRMRALLPVELQARIGELRPGQFVGLRFASDEELASLVEAALKEDLGGEEIKKRIKSWRPDTFRV